MKKPKAYRVITNRRRSTWAKTALDAFVAETGTEGGSIAVSDLITDLGHYCRIHRLDFLGIAANAIGHWHAETWHPDAISADLDVSILIVLRSKP